MSFFEDAHVTVCGDKNTKIQLARDLIAGL